MKKKVKRLQLHRETMHLLAQDGLRFALGGSAATVCRTCPGDPTCPPCGPTHTLACC